VVREQHGGKLQGREDGERGERGKGETGREKG
jgi:hypothetical protein